MSDFINRLNRCGMPMHEAYRTAWDFVKCFGEKALEEFVKDVEANCYVD